VFLLGTWAGGPIRDGKLPPLFYRAKCAPLAFLGRHALLIYVAHQPVLYGACYLIFNRGG